ncbi:hypothetical protein CWO91_39210 [Bradyrhizobium genosp. SA-3]|nr:hypothetical protein CWO91_39210 [Bradyrhizobium genosp. SA-3]
MRCARFVWEFETSSCELRATLAPTKLEFVTRFLCAFSKTLSMTTVMLGSTTIFFSSIGKAAATHHRAIVQFVQAREGGLRSTRRI